MCCEELRSSNLCQEWNSRGYHLAGNLYLGYQGYQPDIRGIINVYQEKIDQISIKYLTDFGRILKNISWIPKYLARYL